MHYYAVIPAAGIGARMGGSVPKQYLKIKGKTILEHTLEKFCDYPGIKEIMVAIGEDDKYWSGLSIATHAKLKQIPGGIERSDSVLNGVQALARIADPDDWVLVHDAVRPCIRKSDIDKLISEASDHPAGGILALPVRDTIKKCDQKNSIESTVDRTGLWQAQTPQMFRIAMLQTALQECKSKNVPVTDEAQAIEFCGHHPLLVEGHPENIKVTHYDDFALAEIFLQQQEVN